MKYEFPVTKNPNPKPKPDPNTLAFGATFTDHMFTMDYDEGQGWHDGKIIPYGDIQISPAASVLHYAQMMFEGMKAYKTEDGHVLLFRPDMNAKRLNRTNERICIPEMDEELFLAAVKATVKEDAGLGTERTVHVALHPAVHHCGRPRAWRKGCKALSLYDNPFARQVRTMRRTVASFRPRAFLSRTNTSARRMAALAMPRLAATMPEACAHRRRQRNPTATMFSGSTQSNISMWKKSARPTRFFMIGDEIVTAPLAGNHFTGHHARFSYNAAQRVGGSRKRTEDRNWKRLLKPRKKAPSKEAFASGTAAVISPMGLLHYLGDEYTISDRKVGEISQKLYDTITGYQTGKLEDTHNWIVRVV